MPSSASPESSSSFTVSYQRTRASSRGKPEGLEQLTRARSWPNQTVSSWLPCAPPALRQAKYVGYTSSCVRARQALLQAVFESARVRICTLILTSRGGLQNRITAPKLSHQNLLVRLVVMHCSSGLHTSTRAATALLWRRLGSN